MVTIAPTVDRRKIAAVPPDQHYEQGVPTDGYASRLEVREVVERKRDTRHRAVFGERASIATRGRSPPQAQTETYHRSSDRHEDYDYPGEIPVQAADGLRHPQHVRPLLDIAGERSNTDEQTQRQRQEEGEQRRQRQGRLGSAPADIIPT
ncbi:MAG: hypothetical protein WBG14_03890 [Rhodococcus sp. (in: high G+C Gram-positive bacteria)]